MSLRSVTRLLPVLVVVAGLAVPAGAAWAAPSHTGEGSVRLDGARSVNQSVDPPTSAAHVVVPMVFPVIGAVSYSDTFLACRGTNCERRHLGQDLMGHKMEPLVAAFSGQVTYIKRETVVGDGNYISIQSHDRLWTVNYLHVNNDTPGTDDGKGTAKYAILPGLKVGNWVAKGQLIGWLGDSGNAETVGPHCHFELRRGDAWSGTVFNATYSLRAAPHITTPVTSAPHQPGELVRWAAGGPIMLLMSDGGRRAVPASMMPVYALLDADVVTISYDEVILYPYEGIAPLFDGSVVSSDGVYWAVSAGRRYAVTESWLTATGLSAAAAVPVTAEALLGTPVATGAVPGGQYRQGAFIHEYGNTQMYRMDRGQMRPIHQGTWLLWHLPGSRVATFPVGTLSQAGAPPVGAVITYKDGSIYRTTTHGTYMLVNGIRRQIADANSQVYYNWRSKRQYWLYESVNDILPLGSPIG